MTAGVTLRAVTRACDRDLVRGLSAARFVELLGATPLAEMQVRAQHTSYSTSYGEAGHCLVLLDDQPVGRVWTAPVADATHVVDLLLEAAARGRGVGHAVVEHLLAAGRPLTASVLVDDPLARDFWAREGFVSLGSDGVRLTLRHPGRAPGPASTAD